MHSFDQELDRRLATLHDQGLRRWLRRMDSPQGTRIVVDGGELLNFSSNDYLGLANHPSLEEAAVQAVERFGAGAGASRLICGSLAPHHELEDRPRLAPSILPADLPPPSGQKKRATLSDHPIALARSCLPYPLSKNRNQVNLSCTD
jgi:hypothetical protein